MEEDGASGHANPGDDKSLPSEDASQPDEPLDARVERWVERQSEKRMNSAYSGLPR